MGREAEDIEPESREPWLGDLTGLFLAHMTNMDAGEAQRNQQYTQREHQFKALQHQFSLLQLEVQARMTPTPNPLLTVGDSLESPDCSSLSVAKGGLVLLLDSSFDW